MIPLALLIFIFLGATLAGSAMVVALTLGYTTAQPLIIAAAAGFLVAIPASWVAAKRINNAKGG